MNKKEVTSWCFTIFDLVWDPTIIEWEELNVRYVVCQKELSPTTKKVHWQGYIQFTRTVKMATVKKRLGCNSAHLETAKGTWQENKTYCTKKETRHDANAVPYEFGKPGLGQGKRSDMDDIAHDIKNGMSEKEISDKYPSQYMRYHNGIAKLKSFNIKPRTSAPVVSVYWGDTNMGKSRKALWEARALMTPMEQLVWWEHVYYKGSGKWWDGYVGQKFVIIDDYDSRDTDLKRNYMLKLTDRYPFRVEVKGSSCWFAATNIWITTNDYCGDDNPFGFGPAFRRRIKNMEHFEINWVPPFEWDEVKVIGEPRDDIIMEDYVEEENEANNNAEIDSLFNEEAENHVLLENYLAEGGAYF